MNSPKNNSKRTLRSNIKSLMTECKITIAELHRQTDVPLTTIKRICNSDDANPTISSLLPIAEFFSITINQLIGIDPLPNERIVGTYIEKRENWINLPILTWEQAINWPNSSIDLKTCHYISTDAQVGAHGYALVVNEDDWMGFFKGSVLIIDLAPKPAHKDYVVTYKKNQERASFNQLLVDEGVSYLKPLNPNYKTKIVDRSYKFLGVLVQIRMDVKNPGG